MKGNLELRASFLWKTPNCWQLIKYRVLPWYWHLVMQCWLDILPLSSWNVLNDPWSHLRDSVTIPIVLAALLQAETIRPWFISTCGHLPPLEQPTRSDWQVDAIPSPSRERKMEGLHDASKKSEFSSLSVTLWLSWDKEGRRKIFHVSPAKVKAKSSATVWAKNKILLLLLLRVLLTYPEDLVYRPLGW